MSVVGTESLVGTAPETGRLTPDDDPRDEGVPLENFAVSHASCSGVNGGVDMVVPEEKKEKTRTENRNTIATN